MNIFSKIDINEIDNLLIDTNKDISLTKSKLFRLSEFIENSSKKFFFLFIENSKEAISFYIQLIRLNHVPIILDPNLDDDSILKLLDNYKPNYILSLKKIENVKNYTEINKFNNYVLYEENKKIFITFIKIYVY